MGRWLIDMYMYLYNASKTFNNKDGVAIVFLVAYLFMLIGFELGEVAIRVCNIYFKSSSDIFYYIFGGFILVGLTISIWLYIRIVNNGLYLKLCEMSEYNTTKAKVIGFAIYLIPMVLVLVIMLT